MDGWMDAASTHSDSRSQLVVLLVRPVVTGLASNRSTGAVRGTSWLQPNAATHQTGHLMTDGSRHRKSREVPLARNCCESSSFRFQRRVAEEFCCFPREQSFTDAASEARPFFFGPSLSSSRLVLIEAFQSPSLFLQATYPIHLDIYRVTHVITMADSGAPVPETATQQPAQNAAPKPSKPLRPPNPVFRMMGSQ